MLRKVRVGRFIRRGDRNEKVGRGGREVGCNGVCGRGTGAHERRDREHRLLTEEQI